MNFLKKIIEKLKRIFVKEKELVMLNEGNDNLNEKREMFKESIRFKIEKISKNRKKVETHICYGDGLGIKKKMEA